MSGPGNGRGKYLVLLLQQVIAPPPSLANPRKASSRQNAAVSRFVTYAGYKDATEQNASVNAKRAV
jgi:hypothetical protein